MTVVFYALTDRELLLNRLPVAHHLRDAGYRIVFIGNESSGTGELHAAGFEYYVVPAGGRATVSDMLATLRLTRILRRVDADILHTFGLRAAVRGGLAARLAHASWVVHSAPVPRQGIRKRPSPLLRIALSRAEVTFFTKDDRDAFIAHTYVRPEQTHVLRSTAIDLRKIPKSDEPSWAPVAAFVATASGDNLREFTEAAASLKSAAIEARFAVIGPAPSPEMRKRLHQLQERGVVEWWGVRPDLTKTLASVHVICLPSDIDQQRVLQAGAVGRPIIAIGQAADTTIVRHDENGLVVPAGDSSRLASTLQDLLYDTEKRKRMGRRARDIVETNYSAERVAREIMVVYERLFERGRSI